MTLLAALAGVLVVGGLLAVVAGLRHVPERPTPARRDWRLTARLADLDQRTKVLLAVGLAAGVIVWLVSGWLVAVVIGPAAAAGIPYLLAAPSSSHTARLDALKDWCWTLKGSLITGMSLEEAIAASLTSTPAAVKPEVTMLVHRLQARTRTETALRAFAEDLNDATGDLVVGNLILASRRRGQGLADLLGQLAESVSEEVKVRQQIEAQRASVRAEARWVTAITLLILGGLALRSDYIAPYGTPLGQILLILLLTAFAGLLIWMRTMAAGKPLPRFMAAADTQDGRR